MSGDTDPRVGEVLPRDAWGMLNEDPGVVLIDVRTRAEWSYVGIPDLRPLPNPFLKVEWEMWPDMSVNPLFVDEVNQQLLGLRPENLLFICRSGVRSLHAAKAMSLHLRGAEGQTNCLNVATGFEGDRDDAGHRGLKNGWKAAGLAWRQS